MAPEGGRDTMSVRIMSWPICRTTTVNCTNCSRGPALWERMQEGFLRWLVSHWSIVRPLGCCLAFLSWHVCKDVGVRSSRVGGQEAEHGPETRSCQTACFEFIRALAEWGQGQGNWRRSEPVIRLPCNL